MYISSHQQLKYTCFLTSDICGEIHCGLLEILKLRSRKSKVGGVFSQLDTGGDKETREKERLKNKAVTSRSARWSESEEEPTSSFCDGE
jgi:hypothetical protein